MKILKLKKNNFEEIKNEAIRVIKEGGVAVLPTDTIYGLIADATNKKAVEKIYKIKKRDKRKPLPIFVKDIKEAKKYAKIDKEKEKFLKAVWPGKVTAILEKKKKRVYGTLKNLIGLRIPKYRLINEILKETNLPLTGTSFNISGKEPKKEVKKLIKEFYKMKPSPDLFIDGGNLKKNKPSIVIDLKSGKIIRS
jgi:L-threonylcarbamoyladenylate synthase